MSLSRFFTHNDLFRDPFVRDPFFAGHRGQHFTEPLFSIAFNPTGRQLAVDLSEQGDTYLIETEVPGFKKENIDVKIGDGGRSITVSGKLVSQTEAPTEETNKEGMQLNSCRNELSN